MESYEDHWAATRASPSGPSASSGSLADGLRGASNSMRQTWLGLTSGRSGPNISWSDPDGPNLKVQRQTKQAVGQRTMQFLERADEVRKAVKTTYAGMSYPSLAQYGAQVGPSDAHLDGTDPGFMSPATNVETQYEVGRGTFAGLHHAVGVTTSHVVGSLDSAYGHTMDAVASARRDDPYGAVKHLVLAGLVLEHPKVGEAAEVAADFVGRVAAGESPKAVLREHLPHVLQFADALPRPAQMTLAAGQPGPWGVPED